MARRIRDPRRTRGMVISQGDIFWADFGRPRGSEPGGRRPALVIQSDSLNRSPLRTVIVAALTTGRGPRAFSANVGFRKGEGETWSNEETGLLEAFTAQLETALEGARLYQDVQRRASEDRLVGELTARLRASMDVDTVLQTAVREMGSALGIEKVELRLESPESPGQEPQRARARTAREEDRYAGVD